MKTWKQKQKNGSYYCTMPLNSSQHFKYMGDISLIDWMNRPVNKRILFSFTNPKTPTQVKTELGINKFSLKPFIKRELLECLNPESYKGRLCILTNKARKLLKIPRSDGRNKKDYDLMGYIMAGPRQRYVVLKTLSLNPVKRTSEEIRLKSSHQNPCLSRISTKSVLEELTNKGLVETEKGRDRKRYYWIT